MKYIFIILLIVGIASAATLFLILPQEHVEPEDTVVVINGQAISRAQIQEFKEKDPHHGQSQDFIDEIITKQLLIAEAQRLGIDKEHEFRKALKTFYEHSLIKILMERVDSEIKVAVSDKEIETYLDAFGKTFTFYTLKTPTDVKTDEIKNKGTRYVSKFDELSESLQLILAGLEPGQSVVHFVTGNEKFAILLEDVTGTTEKTEIFNKQRIRELLLQSKKEDQVNKWIEGLRSKASITYHERQE